MRRLACPETTGVEGLGGGRARRRLEPVGEDYEPAEAESPVTDEVEEVEPDDQPAEDEEVVGGPAAHAGDPGVTLEALASMARREAVYGSCLVELRDKLRRAGELDGFRAKVIAEEVRRVRSRLRSYGAYALTLSGSCDAVPDPVLRELCREAEASGAAPAPHNGAQEPWVVLSLLRRYHPQCYRLVAGLG